MPPKLSILCVGVGLCLGCGTGVTDGQGDKDGGSTDGGADQDQHSNHDATGMDGQVVAEGGAPDASACGTPDAGKGVTSCFVLTGTGASQTCSYTASSAPGFSCSSIAGSSAGACPSTNLYGCCLQLPPGDGGAPADGGAEALTGTCYYSADAGTTAESTCEVMAYMGFPDVWDSCSP